MQKSIRKCYLKLTVALLVLFSLTVTFLMSCYGLIPGSFLPFLGALLGGFVITMLVGLWLIQRASNKLSDQMVGSIKRITSRLSLIEKGDYNVYIDYPQQDEIAPVVNTINSLTQSVSNTVRQLTREKKKMNYLLDNMDSGLLLIDNKRCIQQCNSSVFKYFDCRRDLVGAPVSDLCGRPVFLKAVDHALDNEVGSVFDLNLMEETGAVVSVRVNPIAGDWLGNTTATTSAVVIVTNVTQARQMEEMRSEFIANISHELKTPITSIRGFSELLESGVVTNPNTVQEYIGRIHEEADRMTNLIEDILRLSTLEAGEAAQQKREPVNLASLCEDIFYSLTPQMNKKSISHQLKGTATFVADPDDMRQLMKNLIENGVKYNVEGGSVTVRLVGEAYRCVISVSDTGIGIPIEHQPRIFERFYRVDKGRSKREGGTGLGLSIVKHIVAKYGGQITLTSRVDAGTTIKIILPVQGAERKNVPEESAETKL